MSSQARASSTAVEKAERSAHTGRGASEKRTVVAKPQRGAAAAAGRLPPFETDRATMVGMFEGSQASLVRSENGGTVGPVHKPLLSTHSTYMCTAVGIVLAIGFVIGIGFVIMQKKVSATFGV